MRFELSDIALASMESIGAYTEDHWGIAQRDRYLDELDACFRKLAKTPLMGGRRDNLKAGLLSYHSGKHLVFYFIRDDGILIVDILHESMDIAARKESWTRA